MFCLMLLQSACSNTGGLKFWKQQTFLGRTRKRCYMLDVWGSQAVGRGQKWSWINLRLWVLVRIGVGEALVGVKVADLSHGFGHPRFSATT